MPLETASTIDQLVPTNPVHTDGVNQGDGHLRLIKSVLQATFPSFVGALSSANAKIDQAVNAVVDGTHACVLAAGSVGAPTLAFLGNATSGLYSSAANIVDVAISGVRVLSVAATGLSVFGALSTTGNATVGGTLAATGAYSGGTGQLIPVGLPLPWFDDTLPSPGNWIWLNGQAISRTGNPILFARWGTRFGAGDGSTTFNVPDTRDVAFVGKGTMGGVADRGLIALSGINTTGSLIGEATHTLSTAEIPAHTHNNTLTNNAVQPTVDGGNTQWSSNGPATGGGAAAAGSGVSSLVHTLDQLTTNVTITNASAGSGGAHNNVQPSLVCNWICVAG